MEKEKTKKKIDIKRIVSALIGFPLVAIIMVLGNKYIVDVAMAIIAGIAIHEYLNAVSKKAKPVRWLAYLSCVSIAFIHIVPAKFIPTIGFIVIPTILLILFIQIILTNMKTTFSDIAYTFLGICYAVFFSMCIAIVRGMENGKVLIWYAIIAAWGTDIFAYLIGKRFGKHKFSKISPNKSIEGCIAGIIGTIIFTIGFTYVMNIAFNMQISLIKTTIIGVVLSVIGQIGDFAASSIKREVEVKDFGNLIPGHGGMLDRIDSLLFIAPFAYVLLSLI